MGSAGVWALRVRSSGHTLGQHPQHPSTWGPVPIPILYGPFLDPQAITHPSWNPTTMNNDLTLLKLASPAQYTTRISPVCLASSNEALPEGLTCVTTGWGRLSGVGRILGQRSGWESRLGTSHLGPNHPFLAYRQCDSSTPAASGSALGHRESVPAVLGLPHH